MFPKAAGLLLGLLIAACPAFAQDATSGASGAATSPLPDGKGDSTIMRQLGAGAGYGSYEGNNQWTFSIQSNNAQIGNGVDPHGGDGQLYAFGKTNLDVGQAGISFGLETHIGKNLWSRKNNETVVPLVGVEPFNFGAATSIGFDSGSFPHRALGHEPFWEYVPMVALGAQLFTDSCKAMAMVRGGGGVGSLGATGDQSAAWAAAYGAGVSGICDDLLMFNADVTRLVTSSSAVDEASLMAAVQVPGGHFSVGVDVDARSTKALSQAAPVYSLPTSAGPATEMSIKGVVGVTF